MLVDVVVAPYFETNCWIISAGPNSEAIVVDPGIGAIPTMPERIKAVLAKHKLKPIATLLTHGHLDHTFSVKPLADGYGIPALIHPQDRILLTQPGRALTPGGESEKLMTAFGVTNFDEPIQVREVLDGEKMSLAGLDLVVRHAPGHTKGSIVIEVNSEILIAGDVLFAGAIGRTDLPTGSPHAMIETLKQKILPLEDAVIVLPGHGRQTTIGRERTSNPYLQDRFLNGKPR
ncbi:MAG: MBL fold metallo-hydrolase [Actinomycetes bacterium]